MKRDIFTPAGGPPDVQRPSDRIFAAMGEDGIRRMISDFYAALYASPVRDLFPEDQAHAAEKSADYFIGLLGGPPLFQQKHGPPMLRARHIPFAIDETARRVWLECFEGVLADSESQYGFPPEHLEGFKTFIETFSKWMVNTRQDA